MRRCLLRPRSPLAALALVAALSSGSVRSAATPVVGTAPSPAGEAAGDLAARRVQPVPTDLAAPVATPLPPTSTAPPTSTTGAPAPTVRATTPVAPATTAPETTTTTLPATTTTVAPLPTTTTTVVSTGSLPEPGRNEPGHFSGRILRDDRPLAGVTVKVVNIQTPGWPRTEVLDTLGGHDGVDVFVTMTDANGDWSVTGLPSGKRFMLKVFPPSLCDAHGEIAAAYRTAESGFIATNGEPFTSTRLAPGAATYNVGSTGRYLFDMPVHVYPTVAGALDADRGYSDLHVRFYTRTGSFSTSRGTQAGCAT